MFLPGIAHLWSPLPTTPGAPVGRAPLLLSPLMSYLPVPHDGWRYDDGLHQFHNPYDRGVVRNVLSFFVRGHPASGKPKQT